MIESPFIISCRDSNLDTEEKHARNWTGTSSGEHGSKAMSHIDIVEGFSSFDLCTGESGSRDMVDKDKRKAKPKLFNDEDHGMSGTLVANEGSEADSTCVDAQKKLTATLVQRVLYPEHADNEIDCCYHESDWEESRQQSARKLLPLMSKALSQHASAMSTEIPTKDWVSICNSLLQLCPDLEIVNGTATMLCRLIADDTATILFYQHNSLLTSLAMVLENPFTPTFVQRDIVAAFYRLTHAKDLRQGHHANFLSKMARQPKVLHAVSQRLSSSSRTNPSHHRTEERHLVMSIFMVLSRQVSNHRVLARQNGLLAFMIGFVRDYHETETLTVSSGVVSGDDVMLGGKEALKARILEIAKAL